ncbi:MAG: FeoA family protein [Spirochaetales bacterium]|nr:FeoA family protein [Spirochaetales bacterium]
MTLNEGSIDQIYRVGDVKTDDPGMKEFLFSLGCYPGERICIISRLSSALVVNIKDARYSLDSDLASAIILSDGAAESLVV